MEETTQAGKVVPVLVVKSLLSNSIRIMCTQEQVREALTEEFNRKDGLREQIITDVKINLDAEIGKFARRQTVTALMLTIAALGGWFSLYYQVQTVERAAINHASVADLDHLEQTVNEHSEALKDVATRQDVERIYQAITRIENKLFNY